MNRNEEVKYAIKKIREWDNLTLLEKICRKKTKPSIVDHNLESISINKQTAIVQKEEVKE